MYVAQLTVYILWRIGTDPDHSAIPIITSFSDLVGIGLLFGVFELLQNTSCESIDNVDLLMLNNETLYACPTNLTM